MKKYQFAIGLMLFYMLSCTSIKSFKGRTYYDYNEYRVSKLQFDSDSTLTIFNEFINCNDCHCQKQVNIECHYKLIKDTLFIINDHPLEHDSLAMFSCKSEESASQKLIGPNYMSKQEYMCKIPNIKNEKMYVINKNNFVLVKQNKEIGSIGFWFKEKWGYDADEKFSEAARPIAQGAVLFNPIISLTNSGKTLITGSDIYGNEADGIDYGLSVVDIATFGCGQFLKLTKPIVKLNNTVSSINTIGSSAKTIWTESNKKNK